MKFKPEDFSTNNIMKVSSGEITLSRETAVKLANAKLQKWLDQAPVVYGVSPAKTNRIWDSKKGPCDEYKARLVCIEEVVKEPCKHEGILTKGKGSFECHEYYYSCSKCDVRLEVPEWKEKK